MFEFGGRGERPLLGCGVEVSGGSGGGWGSGPSTGTAVALSPAVGPGVSRSWWGEGRAQRAGLGWARFGLSAPGRFRGVMAWVCGRVATRLREGERGLKLERSN